MPVDFDLDALFQKFKERQPKAVGKRTNEQEKRAMDRENVKKTQAKAREEGYLPWEGPEEFQDPTQGFFDRGAPDK